MPPARSSPTVDGDEADDSNPMPAATRRRRWLRPVGAVVLAAALACTAAGCLAPAPSGPSPAVDSAIHAAFDSAGAWAVICMTEVAGRESHWDPGAQNPSGASGLFQIMLPLHDDLFWALGVSPAAWSDPYWNAQAARELWNAAGIAPWGSC